MLDFDTCNTARLNRDPAYDGVFFIGVSTTKIYCRPVCPVKQPMTKNVSFYPSAAAAESAGFRPCLRCRPETAPFSPAWNGTQTTVSRAMRLIEQGALDGAKVEELALKLGVGSRHLTRLFARHVGASPVQVAKTMRVQRAKRLLSSSSAPLREIALLSGFGSVRRFNAVFCALYGRPPSSISRPRAPTQSQNVNE
ncbi:MAG: helix-turn-helix domain-containing protein [Devosiaceae bacterium]|nr:helix-turn-helix domain-containing protein [Devosiaceae bacterium]